MTSGTLATTEPVAERSAWRDRRFVVFAVGNTLNNIGEGIYGIALPLLLLHRTGSLGAMSLLAAIAPLMLTVGGPVFGGLADRYGSRVLVVPGLLVQLSAALALNVYLAVGHPPTAVLFFSELLVQAGGVAYRGGWMAGVPSMFPDKPGRARGALSTCYTATIVIGPALAAGLVDPLGYLGLLWINLATFVAPLVVWAMGIKPSNGRSPEERAGHSFWRHLQDGWAMLRGSGNAWTVLLVLVPCNFVFSIGTITLAIYYFKHSLGMSATAVGAAMACVNVGALLGAFLVSEGPSWRIRPLVLVTLLGSAACLMLVPATTIVVVAVGALVVIMLLDSVVSVAAEMLLYRSVPPEAIGRSIGLVRLILGFPQFLAPAVISALSGVIGVRGAFVLLGAVAFVPGLWIAARPDSLR